MRKGGGYRKAGNVGSANWLFPCDGRYPGTQVKDTAEGSPATGELRQT